MPSQTIPLTPDEQECLRQHRVQHCAQAHTATSAIQPPLDVDLIPNAMSSQDTMNPSTSSLGLSLTSTPSYTPRSSLSFSTQIPLGYPVARGASTPSSTTVASPLVQATLPTERLAQRRTIKWHHSLLKSSNEDGGADGGADGGEDGGEDGSAALEAPIDLLLDDLVKMHKALTKPQSMFVVSKASGSRVENLTHLLAKRDAFASQLLGVVKTMATQLKGLQARVGEGDIQVISHVHTGTDSQKKLKVERTPIEQQLHDLVKVCTST